MGPPENSYPSNTEELGAIPANPEYSPDFLELPEIHVFVSISGTGTPSISTRPAGQEFSVDWRMDLSCMGIGHRAHRELDNRQYSISI